MPGTAGTQLFLSQLTLASSNPFHRKTKGDHHPVDDKGGEMITAPSQSEEGKKSSKVQVDLPKSESLHQHRTPDNS
jgi:hypothetical protein